MKKYFVAVIFLASLLLGSSALAATPSQAKLRITADDEKLLLGDVLHFTVRLDSENLVNIASAYVHYDPAIFDFVKASKANTSANVWMFEPKLAAKGRIKFGAGFVYPGFEGSGEIFNFDLRAKAYSTSSQVFFKDEQILVADGTGANYRVATNTLFVVVSPKTASSAKGFTKLNLRSTHGNGVWSRLKHIAFNWPAGYKALYAFDKKPTTVPTKTLKSPTRAVLDVTTDGIYYFHLKLTDGAGKVKIYHYKIAVDTKKPVNLSVSKTLPKKAGGLLTIKIKVRDSGSGIANYSVILDGKAVKTLKPTYVVAVKNAGTHRLTVRAFDKAGNFIENSSSFTLK